MKVLVVEDEQVFLTLWELELRDHQEIVIIFAHSIEEAEEKFLKNLDLSAIVMDGRVPGKIPSSMGAPNTLSLVRKFRDKFGGPIIAASCNHGESLVEAGCNLHVPKDVAPKKIIEILHPSSS